MHFKKNFRSMWSTRKTPVVKRVWLIIVSFYAVLSVTAQSPVTVGGGSFASFVPLAESASSSHGGCQAYQMEHRPIYAVDSLLTRPLPSNDWWTYGLVNPWTGNLWAYPAVTWATDQGISVAKLTHWEPTGSEMKWETPVFVSTVGADSKPIFFSEKRLSDWSDFMIRFVMEQDGAQVEVTVMRGSPIVWMEFTGCQPAAITNPKSSDFAIYQQTVGDKIVVAIAVLAEGQTAATYAPYAYRIPRRTRYTYAYTAATAKMSTTFHVDYQDLVSTSAQGVAMGFLPHHYKNTTSSVLNPQPSTYATPRGEMRMAYGNDFTFTYDVHPMLPFFPLPDENLEGYSADRMQQLCQQYAAAGSFGADTYWGGKGLTQMMHYMTTSLQMGDTATYRMAKKRLKENLINWYTYTPGETQFYFAYYDRWRAMVGFDVSYDSDTFNDHHFHYGYFIYASAVLCMLDPDFKEQYGAMAREVARDYANWTRDDYSNPDLARGVRREPWFRMFSPYDGHSFAGGMGNAGNGNGQESTSESMQSWVGIWMLGMALNDPEMIQAGVMGYTVEARATAEYWFDRDRTNIDYEKYKHPWCCNLTMAGVGWWTWFSGDPVWMHSIQWLPISPGLQNYLTENRTFTAWDYTEMYSHKEVGNYEAAKGGLGDESGLGNVCLSYLALFDPDSAAHVWDRMDQMGKALAKNADTGGITYLLAHGLRQYGHHNHAITADYPLAAAYTTDGGVTTYVVYNVDNASRTVRFIGNGGITVTAPANALSFFNASGQLLKSTEPIADDTTPRPKDPIAENWHHAYPNVALNKPATASSEENAGTRIGGLTDGNLTTRWGSAHRDNEWAQVDLGELYYIDHITLRWEASYASRFELSLSPDGTNWHTVTYAGSGGVDTRDFAGDLLMQGDSARGRYIRIVGLERGTTYGTSLYELEAYGLPLSGNSNVLTSLEILSNQISLVPNQEPEYEVHGYNYLGTELPITPTITPTITADRYTITATVDELSASYTWPILEQVATVAARVTPRSVILSPGDEQEFKIETVDQFGYTTNSSTETYTAEQLGLDTVLYTLDGLTDTAFISVIPFTERNLALGKPANCSGYEDGATLALNVNDGKNNTRWGSRHQDNEWVQVDLGANYLINRIRILWEVSYASSYEIQFSDDMLAWTTAYETTTSDGNVDDILLPTASARYVRVLCRVRHNPTFGSSIWELEVYGLPKADTEAPVLTEATLVSKTYQDAVLAVSATDNDHVISYLVYNGEVLLGEYAAVDGQISVTGLMPATNYTLRVLAKDCSGNLSSPVNVEFSTDGLPTDRPQIVAPTPVVEDGGEYRSVYSDVLTSSLAHGFQFNPWGGATASYDVVFGTNEEYMLFETATNQSATIGVNDDGANAIIAKDGMSDPENAEHKGLYVAGMKYCHIDIWSQVAKNDVRVLLNDHALTGINLAGTGWQSFDIELVAGDLNDAKNVRWMKFNGLPADTKVAIDNLYFWKPEDVSVTGVSLNKAATMLLEDAQETLVATVAPANATLTDCNWASNNTAVATVAGGVVTAVAPGEATITVTTVDGGFTATCVVTVNPDMTKPQTAAPAVDETDKEIRAIYSDDVELAITNAEFGLNVYGNAPYEKKAINGNNFLLYTATEGNQVISWGGVHGNANALLGKVTDPADAGAKGLYVADLKYLHIDIWSNEAATNFQIQNDNNLICMVNLDGSGWQSFDIDMTGKENLLKNISIIKFTNTPRNTRVAIDNLYFWKPEKVIPVIEDPVATASSEVGANVAGNALVKGGRWESAQTDDEWWMINYYRLHSFNAIKIEWEGAYAKEFTIEGSLDGTNFDVLYTETNGSAGEHIYDLAGVVNYQYIKVNITQRGTGWGNSIIYFEAYVAESPELTTLTLSAAKAYAAIGQNVALRVTGKDQYNAPMPEFGTVEYTVTPAAAGSVVADQFVPAQKGRATITARVGEVVSNTVEVWVITENVNLALSTNITTDNKIIAQSGNGANDAFHAVNANDGDTWNTPDPSTRTYDAWFVVDLGANFDLELATVHFEGASSKNFHIDASLDNVVWTQVATGTTPGMQNITTVHGITATTARFVRFWSTEAATGYGLKVYTFQVFGQRNTAADVHPSAVTLNKTATSILEGGQETLTATVAPDDAVNKAITWTSSADAIATVANGVVTAVAAGQATITVTTVDGGLTATCVVTVTPDMTKPQTAAPAVDTDGKDIRAVYSDDVELAIAHGFGFNPWGGAPVSKAVVAGNNYLLADAATANNFTIGTNDDGANAIIAKPGMSDPENAANKGLYVAGMKYCHIDIWSQVAKNNVKVLINDRALTSINLTNGGWQSFDIELVAGDMAAAANVRWMKVIDLPTGTKVAIDNLYFWNPNGSATVTGVSLSETALDIEAGFQATLTASVLPMAADQTVTWETSDPTIATVTDGVVSALAAGDVTIIARSTADPTKFATCAVTVQASHDRYYYGYGHNAHVDFTFHLIYNIDHTITVVAPYIFTDRSGVTSPSVSIADDWKDMTPNGEGGYARTTTATFTYGENVHCFLYQPYAGGAARYDFDYTVGAENELPSFSLTTVDDDFYSFYYPYEVTIPDGITAFTGSLSNTQLVLHQVTGNTIPAYTAVLVKTDIPGTYVFPAVETRTAPFPSNSLLGVATQTSFEDLGEDATTKILTLGVANGVVGFRQHNSNQTSLKANRVYLKWQSAAMVTVRIVMIATSVEEVEEMPHVQKLIRNGQVYIVRDGQTYNILGL